MSTHPHHLDGTAIRRLMTDTEPWLSCEDCFEQVDAYVEALLQDADHSDPAMRAHLRGCPACAEEADSLLELLKATGPSF